MSATDQRIQPGAASTSTPSRRAAAAVVVAGPLLVLLSELLAPREPDGRSPAESAALLLSNDGRFAASWSVGLAAAAFLSAGYVVAAGRVRGRGAAVARVAGVLGVLGATGLAGHMAVSLAGRDILLGDPGAVGAADAVFNGLSAVTTVLPVVLGLNLAVLLLAVAAFRARWAGWWIVGLGALALVADFSPTSYNTILHEVFALPVFVAVALRVARPGAA